jgi:Spy/CpxP family protein refolding chaperone
LTGINNRTPAAGSLSLVLLKESFMKRLLVLGAALAAAASFAFAQGPGHGYGPGYGPGYERGMMGYGPGGGFGPGMMGGGPGAGGALAALNLTDEQREKVFAIQEEHRKKNWGAMGEVRSEQFKLRNMYRGEKLDADKIAEQQKKVDGLRQQMLKSRVEAHNQIAAVLTPEQRKQLRQYSPGWLGDVEE